MECNTKTQLNFIRDQLQTMALSVENAVKKSSASFSELDSDSAMRIIDEDKSINSFEIDIDNSTFNILAVAVHQLDPDTLRFLLSVQKLNPVLERIGDHAVNIAEAVISLSEDRYGGSFFTIDTMAEKCIAILHDAILSFFERETSLATDVLQRDDSIDLHYSEIINNLKIALMDINSDLQFDSCFNLVSICKDLERIADLSMNIAEEAFQAYKGIIMKHRTTEIEPSTI